MKTTELKMTTNCKNCGAPVTTEICPYCNSFTGIDLQNADMTYPLIDCIEANIGFFSVAFPAIFAVAFGIPGLAFMFAVIAGAATDGMAVPSFLGALLFVLIGVVAAVIALKPLILTMVLRAKGKRISGTVHGYLDDNMLINDRPAQVAKILIQTQDGPRYIMYQMGKTMRPYGVNSTVSLLAYKNYFQIEKAGISV